MKTLAVIYFCFAFSATIIYGNSDTEEDVPLFEELNRIAGNNGIVNDIFKPAINGFLGDGSCGFVYQGELLKPIERNVAMKFVSPRNKEFIEEEYTIYTCLNAINNADVERYGIPSVYYYGSYKNYTMIGFTLLNEELSSIFDRLEFDIVDIFIAIREFARITKYIHGHGIQHNDIRLEHMMFRRNQAFIIDYNVAIKMYDTKNTTISPAIARQNAKQLAKIDWQRFFFAMTHYAGVCFDLPNFGSDPKIDLRMILEQLEVIDYSGLKRVLIEIAKHAIGDGSESDNLPLTHGVMSALIDSHDALEKSFYDQLYEIINDEIAKFELPESDLVSWLKDEEIEEAQEELATMPDISSINDCFEKADAKYPEVHFDYFDKLNAAAGKCSEVVPSSHFVEK